MDKTKSNEKAKVESKTASKQEEPEEPVEDDSGYLVPAELLRAQKQLSQEEKGGEPKERSSIGISLGKHCIEISLFMYYTTSNAQVVKNLQTSRNEWKVFVSLLSLPSIL